MRETIRTRTLRVTVRPTLSRGDKANGSDGGDVAYAHAGQGDGEVGVVDGRLDLNGKKNDCHLTGCMAIWHTADGFGAQATTRVGRIPD